MNQVKRHSYNNQEYNAYQPDITSFYEGLKYDDELVSKVSSIQANMEVLQHMLEENPFLIKAARLLQLEDSIASSAIDGGIRSLEEYGLQMLQDDMNSKQVVADIQMPLDMYASHYKKSSLRKSSITIDTIEDFYARLMHGQSAEAQKIRTKQIWIGPEDISQAIYIPPNTEELRELLAKACDFLNTPSVLSPVLRMALFQADFFLLLPFTHANAKISRMILPFLVAKFFHLPVHVVPVSLCIKEHLKKYNTALQKIYKDGDIMTWIHTYTELLLESTAYSRKKLQQILDIYNSACTQLESRSRTTKHMLPLFNALFFSPVIDGKIVMFYTKLTKPNANQLIDICVELGILKEITNAKRNRKYVCPPLMDILDSAYSTHNE